MTKNTANFLNIDWEKELSKWKEQQKEKAKQEKLSNNFSFIFKYLFILFNLKGSWWQAQMSQKVILNSNVQSSW